MPRPTKTIVVHAEYQPLVAVLAAACAGILLDRWLAWSPGLWTAIAIATWAVWFVCWRRALLRGSALVLLASVAATAGAWHHCRWSLFADDNLAYCAPHVPGPVALEVRATSGPRRIPAPPPDPLRTVAPSERTRLEVEVLSVRNGAYWQPTSGRASLFVSGNLTDVRAGDVLRAFGQWTIVRPPANPGEFDFAAQARSTRRIVSLNCEFPECLTTQSHSLSRLPAEIIDGLRTRGDGLLWRNLGSSRSALGAAMFLGARDELDPNLRQAFVETGTIHLLVVSGLNVTILAGCFFWIMQFGLVPRGWALGIVVIACVLYAATTDGEPPVVRATVMVLVGCLAMILLRRPLGYNTLAAAGLVVLAINPAELFQAGTQLSFLAVGVLVFIASAQLGRHEPDPLERLIARTRRWPVRFTRKFWATAWQLTLATTLIWLVVCPLVMSRFHLVSPVAVLLGPVLTVPVTMAMACGFGIFLFGWLVPPLGALLGIVCDWNLSFMQTCVEMARSWPGSHFWVTGPADWWLAGFYGALACAVFAPRWRPTRSWMLGLVAGWVAVGFVVSFVTARDTDRLECTFLSVGHGTAVVVELPGGQTLLYDAGRLGSPAGAARIVSSFLWSRGITHLDALVISHADADHYNAVPSVLEQISVGRIYVSPVMFENQESRAVQALRQAINKSGAPLTEVWSGDRLRAGDDVRIEVLHPPRRGVLGSDNANSIVLAIEYQGRRLLLTGDLESPGLEDVLAELPYDCDVTMAPHHGSASSDPPGFLAWSTPEWTIVSGGQSDRLPAINQAFSAQGSRVLHTAEDGAVSISIAEGQVSVKGFLAK